MYAAFEIEVKTQNLATWDYFLMALDDYNRYSREIIDNKIFICECNWSSWIQDLTNISTLVNCLIVVKIFKDVDEIYISFFKNGKYYVEQAEIIYPEFNGRNLVNTQIIKP